MTPHDDNGITEINPFDVGGVPPEEDVDLTVTDPPEPPTRSRRVPPIHVDVDVHRDGTSDVDVGRGTPPREPVHGVPPEDGPVFDTRGEYEPTVYEDTAEQASEPTYGVPPGDGPVYTRAVPADDDPVFEAAGQQMDDDVVQVQPAGQGETAEDVPEIYAEDVADAGRKVAEKTVDASRKASTAARETASRIRQEIRRLRSDNDE